MSHFGFRLILNRAGKIKYFGLKWGRENHDIFWSKKAGIMSHTATEFSRTTGGLLRVPKVMRYSVLPGMFNTRCCPF